MEDFSSVQGYQCNLLTSNPTTLQLQLNCQEADFSENRLRLAAANSHRMIAGHPVIGAENAFHSGAGHGVHFLF